MPSESRPGGYLPSPPSVVHVHQTPQSPWIAIGVLGMLCAQFCLMAILAWKLVSGGDSVSEDSLAEKRAAAKAAASTEVVDNLLDRLGENKPGGANELVRQQQEIDRLKLNAGAYESARRDQIEIQKQLESDLTKTQEKAEKELKRFEDKLAKNNEAYDKLAVKFDQQKKELDAIKKEHGIEDTSDSPSGIDGQNPWLWIAGGAVLIALSAGIATIVWKLRNRDLPDFEDPISEDRTSGRSPRHAPGDLSGGTRPGGPAAAGPTASGPSAAGPTQPGGGSSPAGSSAAGSSAAEAMRVRKISDSGADPESPHEIR